MVRINGLMWKSAAFGVVMAVASCKSSPEQTKLLYMPDMVHVPIVKPQREYLDPPVGSVPMYSILYPKDVEEASKVLHNPLIGHEKEAEYRKEGEVLFNKVCFTCHGHDGRGGGPITDLFPRPPDLRDPAFKYKTQGYYFYRITFGGPIMPPMGDKFDPIDRWKIALYLDSWHKGG